VRVLITSAGRRTSLVAGFRDAAQDYGGSVLAADADPLAPGLFAADHGVVLPRLTSPAYDSHLLGICEEFEVGLVVPTIDTELPVLARLSSRMTAMGTVALVSDLSLIEVSADKAKTEEVFAAAGIRTPRSWTIPETDIAELPDRVFIKPRAGSASVDVHLVSRDEVLSAASLVTDPIVQEYVDAAEITVDALLDMDGRVIHLVPRLRLKTVGGESVQGVTLPDESIRAWLLDVLDVVGGLGGRGPITVQAFLTEDSPTLVEVNPRFGGGFPLALRAGGDYPRWILQMTRGEFVAPRIGEYTKGLFMTRSLTEVFVDPTETT